LRCLHHLKKTQETKAAKPCYKQENRNSFMLSAHLHTDLIKLDAHTSHWE